MTVLRLATFNLLHGVSLADGSVQRAALHQAAGALDADVVGLQEVD
nr:endonuclease/exonuclease/phosphatase family protein [Acidothermales bacterium]